MAKRKFTEVEIIAALKRAESGLTYEQVGREKGCRSTPFMRGSRSWVG